MTARRMVWDFIQARDYQVMRKVHRWRPPRWLRFWMIASTRLGDGWVWYSVGIALLLFGGDMRFIAFAASASAEAATVVIFRFLKKASKRKRPCQLESHCWSKVLPPDQFSFPVGPRHERLCHRNPTVHHLSGVASGAACVIGKHRRVPRNPGNALRERRDRRIFAGSRPGVRSIPADPLVAQALLPVWFYER